MKHYKHYSVEDFVQDSRFRSWVRNPSPGEDLIWQSWIRENCHQQGVIAEARAIVLAIHPLHRENISDREIQSEIERILVRINEDDHVAEVSKSDLEREPHFPRWVKIAASISLLLMAGWCGIEYGFLLEKNKVVLNEHVVSAGNYMIERVNKSVDALLINLPDNSSVFLSQNSLIRYPSEFAGEARNVFLEGTAFFEVTKDPDKPFYVNAGKIIAKVLGTSFEISTDQSGKQISVIVKSGTVSIYSNTDNEKRRDDQPEIILTRHEQFIFKDEVSQVQHTRLDSVSIEALNVPDTYLKFTATPASEVFRSLARVYGVQINFEDAEIGECSVTASFTDEPFPLKLDLICRSIGVKYEIVNDQVTITGNGCEN